MKINQNSFNHFVLSSKAKSQAFSQTETKSPSSQNGQDVYQFRLEPKELKSFFDLMKEPEVIREDKLQAIQEQIDNGTYHVTGKSVVSKLLGETVK